MKKKFLNLLFCLGLGKNREDQIDIGWQESMFKAVGRFLSIALLISILGLELWSLSHFPYFIPSSNVEETSNSYTISSNYLEYGFWNSRFRQDLSSSPDPGDHPYAYTRFPPGPDIFTSLILYFSGGSYRIVYCVFALTFIAGVPFYFNFAHQVLQKFRLSGASYTLLLFSPWSIMAVLARFQSAPLLFLIFVPLTALASYYKTKKRWYLYSCLIVGFLSSLYLESSLFAVIFCWFFLYLTQLVRVERKHLLAFLGVFGLGIGLNLFLNLLLLGPNNFMREFAITISNRMFGFPSKEAVQDFYRSIAVVQHGSRPIDLNAFLFQFWTNFQFPGYQFVGLAAGLLIILAFLPKRTQSAKDWDSVKNNQESQITAVSYFGKLALWIVGSIAIPSILFPAYGQEVTLGSTKVNIYFLAIGVVAILAYTLKQVLNGFLLILQMGQFLRLRSSVASLSKATPQCRSIRLISVIAIVAFLPLVYTFWAAISRGVPHAIFSLSSFGVYLLAWIGLIRPALLAFIVQRPRQAVQLTAAVITGLLLILSPAVFFRTSRQGGLLVLETPDYALFLGIYALACLTAWHSFRHPELMTNLFNAQPLERNKKFAGLYPKVKTIVILLLLLVVFDRLFQELIAAWVFFYILACFFWVGIGYWFFRPNIKGNPIITSHVKVTQLIYPWCVVVAVFLVPLAPVALALFSWALHGKMFFMSYCLVSLAIGVGLFDPNAIAKLAQMLQKLQKPRWVIRLVSGVAVGVTLFFLVAVTSNQRFLGFLGAFMGQYLQIYLLAILIIAWVGLVRPVAILMVIRKGVRHGFCQPSDLLDIVLSRLLQRRNSQFFIANNNMDLNPNILDWQVFARIAISVGLIFCIYQSSSIVIQTNWTQLPQIAAQTAEKQPSYTRLVDLRQFAGQLYMTNVYTSTTGFFTQAAGYGVCGPKSISYEGDIDRSQCQVAFMRQHELYAQMQPKYFFFFPKEFHPGFSDCLPSGYLVGQEVGGDSCIERFQNRLSSRFKKVFENSVFQVYDLRKKS